jgi:hypothetical protein
MKHRIAVLLVLVGVFMIRGAIGHAQVQVQPPEVFVVEGRVTWMSGQRMIVAPANDFAVTIDLARISLGDQRLISQGEYVVVTGQLLRPTRTILALSIQIVGAWYPQSP